MVTLEQKFYKLAKQWKEDTMFLSDPNAIYDNSYYKEIISLGPDVIPIIFKELQRKIDFWFEALRQLTGEEPYIAKEDWGRVKVIAEAWLKFGKIKGYIKDEEKEDN